MFTYYDLVSKFCLQNMKRYHSQKCIQNPVKHLRRCVLKKQLTPIGNVGFFKIGNAGFI